MSRIHWHTLNGEIGCIPDNHQIHDRKRDALEYIGEIFPEMTDKTLKELGRAGVVYRQEHPCIMGASVIELYKCDDVDCRKAWLEYNEWD